MVREERQRVLRLRMLVTALERLSPSETRDVLLREVRSRVVAVETGEPRQPAYKASDRAPELSAHPGNHDLHWVDSVIFPSRRVGMSL
jgi:hypothetical protein